MAKLRSSEVVKLIEPLGGHRGSGAPRGAAALVPLFAFASRAAEASPAVARVALLDWASSSRSWFSVVVVLGDSAAGPEEQLAVRKLVQAASVPTLEAGLELVLDILPSKHPRAADGFNLWPPHW